MLLSSFLQGTKFKLQKILLKILPLLTHLSNSLSSLRWELKLTVLYNSRQSCTWERAITVI